MRNLKPSDAAMRRERFVSELSAGPAPSPSLGARIEEISGFESVPRATRSSKPTSGRRAPSGIALIAGSAALLTIVLCVALLPRALC